MRIQQWRSVPSLRRLHGAAPNTHASAYVQVTLYTYNSVAMEVGLPDSAITGKGKTFDLQAGDGHLRYESCGTYDTLFATHLNQQRLMQARSNEYNSKL